MSIELSISEAKNIATLLLRMRLLGCQEQMLFQRIMDFLIQEEDDENFYYWASLFKFAALSPLLEDLSNGVIVLEYDYLMWGAFEKMRELGRFDDWCGVSVITPIVYSKRWAELVETEIKSLADTEQEKRRVTLCVERLMIGI